MQGKLIKHEFKATARLLPVIYLASILLALTCWISKILDLGTIFAMSQVFLFIGAAAVVMVTFVTIIMRYYKSMFGNEGYLTNTLPVSAGKIIFSKFLISVIWCILSLAICVGMILFALYLFGALDKDFFAMLGSMFPNVTSATVWSLITLFGTIFVIQMIYFISQVFFCITLANAGTFGKHPVGMSIAFYFVVYIIDQVISTILILFVPLAVKIDSGGVHLVFETMFKNMSLNIGLKTSVDLQNFSFGLASTVFYVLGTIALLYFTVWMTKKKVSVR